MITWGNMRSVRFASGEGECTLVLADGDLVMMRGVVTHEVLRKAGNEKRGTIMFTFRVASS